MYLNSSFSESVTTHLKSTMS